MFCLSLVSKETTNMLTATAILITNKTMNSIDSPHHGILDKKIVELFSGLYPLTIRRF